MSRMIDAYIEVEKIDKSKITISKNGKKYLNITISINDEANKYRQDTSIYHKQSEDERKNKVNKIYLGNGKTFWKNEQQSVSANEKMPWEEDGSSATTTISSSPTPSVDSNPNNGVDVSDLPF